MKKGEKAVKIVFVLLLALLALSGIIMFVLASTILHGVVGVISGACAYGVFKMSKPVTIVHFTGVVFLGYIMMFTSPFKSGFYWQYNFQKVYAEKAGGFITEGFFPDKMESYSGQYHTEFMPSMLQGSGYYTVKFDTSSIERYQKYAKDNSVMNLRVGELRSDLTEGTVQYIEEKSGKSVTEVYFHIPDEISDEGTAYIIRSNFDWDNPHAEVVFIDGEKTVCFMKQ